ncbi:MAG: AMP-binding protein [Gemmatimonadota bacterium]|nr:MAG: AMP-binding protein [Gemmatimonadota bacterium]
MFPRFEGFGECFELQGIFFYYSNMTVPCDRPWFAFWPKDVPRRIAYPEILLQQILVNSAARDPHHPALISGNTRMTYHELNLASTRFGAALLALGVDRGDRVMLVLPNIPEFVIAYYGVLKIGAIMTAASPLSKEYELEVRLQDADPKVIVCERYHVPLLSHSVRQKSSKILISVGEDKVRDVHRFNELIARANPSTLRHVDRHSKNGLAVLQYTGGTTGRPKGAMMTHSNLVANAIQNALWFTWSRNDIVLGVLSLCHTWGLCTSINSAIYTGATIVLVPRFDPEEVLGIIEKERITIAYGSATMFHLLLDSPEREKRNLSSLRLAKAGAMPIPGEVKRRWDDLGLCELILGYGLTEASPETHDSPLESVRTGTIGIPIIDTDAKIVDIETGTKELGPNEVGELILRGPQVMKGYWKNSQETDGVLREGWLHTGDLATMDEDGFFSIVDRKKDLIKYKGYSIFPAELENALYDHPAVRECAVVGKPLADVGEIPKAYVVVHKGSTVTERGLMEFIEQRCAPFKKIREVEFVGEIPKTVVGKTLRRALRGGKTEFQTERR